VHESDTLSEITSDGQLLLIGEARRTCDCSGRGLSQSGSMALVSFGSGSGASRAQADGAGLAAESRRYMPWR